MAVYQSEFQGATIDARLAAVATMQTAISNLETAVAAKYSKPANGIPETDLDASVQAALGLARTAVQSLSDYYTKAQIDDIAAAIAASVDSTSGVVVATLPSAGAGTLGKIYYVGPDANGFYDRYVTSYDGSTYTWLPLGNTEIDLSDYATKDEFDQLSQEVDFVVENTVHVPDKYSRNIINPANMVSGARILKNNGSVYVDSSYSYAVIDVSELSYLTVSADVRITSGLVIARYNGETFQGYNDEINTYDSEMKRAHLTIDVSSATVVKMSLTNTNWTTRYIQAEAGTDYTPYEDYYVIPGEDFLSLKTATPVLQSFLGSGQRLGFSSMADGDRKLIPAPAMRKNFRIHFYAKITSFDTIYVGKGITDKGYLLKVDNTNIQFKAGVDSPGGTEIAHGLTINTYIDVLISVRASSAATIKIKTLGGAYSRNLASWSNVGGDVFAESIGSTLTECVLDWSCSDFRKPIWIFGDSYLTHYSDARWPYYLIVDDGNDCALINAFPGENSAEDLADFELAIKLGAPRYILWCAGVNDKDNGAVNPNWLDAVQKIQAWASYYGAVLILATIPNLPNYDNTYKNAWVKASGERYIDFAEAVGAEQADSTWIAGCLGQDNVHPTAEGAKLLYARALADVPELLGQEAPVTPS